MQFWIIEYLTNNSSYRQPAFNTSCSTRSNKNNNNNIEPETPSRHYWRVCRGHRISRAGNRAADWCWLPRQHRADGTGLAVLHLSASRWHLSLSIHLLLIQTQQRVMAKWAAMLNQSCVTTMNWQFKSTAAGGRWFSFIAALRGLT